MAKEKNTEVLSKYIAKKSISDGKFSLIKNNILEVALSDFDLSLSPSEIIEAKEGNYVIDLQKQFYLLNIIKGNLVLVK